jgi:sarcosine oxidase subunit alpha
MADPLNVRIRLDGEEIAAQMGEPVVASLVRAGKLALARSPKFHRPRGPACLRAACDGCLARVDDVPNVMTCMLAARDGMDVRTQNTLGSRSVDFLRVTDWFFPEGLNHHEIFAGVPGVQALMQGFARRVAGLGRLPSERSPARSAARREVEVLVLGGGPAGMAAAARIAQKRSVELLDDHLSVGGGLSALGPQDARAWAPIVRDFTVAVEAGRVRVRTSTTAGGLYGDDVLVVAPEGAEIVTARAIVLAPGAHDGVLAFEGNDLPGVMSARAGGWLLARGVSLGAKVAVVVPEGGGPFGEAYARAVKDRRAPSDVTLVHGDPVRASGNARVTSCVVRTTGDGRERKIKCDALLVDAPRAPSYELLEQAGAPLVHTPRGYVPKIEGGLVRPGVFVVGEAAGTPFVAAEIAGDVDRVVTRVTK